MRAAQFLATIGRGSKGSNALEVTEDRAGATSEQQDNVINTVNSLDPYGPSWQLVPGNVAAGTVYAQVPTSGTGDLTFTRASTATRTDAAGNIVSVASGVGRIHYRNADGSLSSVGRLLLEPQRTNSIRNSTMVGAVAGSPGTLPTNWGSATGGLTQTIVGLGTENGLQYIDVRFNGTASGTLLLINFEGSSIISAANAQTWTNAFYFKTIAAPQAPLSYNLHTIQRSSGTNVGSFTLAFTPTTTLTRYAQTVTTNQATITHIQPYFFATLTNGATYDFTIRIAAPQMELGGYATTYIPTTTAAVTRLADLASKTGVSSLIGQTEGTILLDFIFKTPQVISGGQIVITNLSSPFNRVLIWNNNSLNVLAANLQVNGSNIFNTSLGTFVDGQRYKIAVAYKSGSNAAYVNGTQIFTNSNTFTFASSLSQIIVGTYETGLNAHQLLNQAALFPTRLTNAQLAQLTTL